jgi:hypothetical protein
MKFLTYALASLLLLSACKKDAVKEAEKIVDYAGSYKGVVTVTVNGAFSQTIRNSTIVVVNNGNRQLLTLVNNLIYSYAASLSGPNSWTMPREIAVESVDGNLVEYGSGTFAEGGILNIDLTQDETAPNSTVVRKSKRWVGQLVRQ